jgi:hypothetical protein
MGRPKKEPGEVLVEVPCKVPPAVADWIERMHSALDRSRSQLARKLLIRGIAAYLRDGKLDENEEEAPLLAPFGIFDEGLPSAKKESSRLKGKIGRPVTAKKGQG